MRFATSPDGSESFEGEVRACEPPRLLELRWGTDVVRIELAAEGAGTRLTLQDTFAEHGKAARDGAGWHECLARLAADLDGAPVGEWGSVWSALHPRYVAHLGPDAATIGPPSS